MPKHGTGGRSGSVPGAGGDAETVSVVKTNMNMSMPMISSKVPTLQSR